MAISDLDPKLLVEAHNGGDDHAFAQIVRAHDQGLFAHALSRLHDVQAAEDAVQETFVRAYRAMPRFEGDFHLRAWLHRILTNVCHDEGARRRRDGLLVDRVSCQEVVGGEAADVDIERLDLRPDVVAQALGQLSDSYREALVLRYVQELSYEEVAAATGVTEGNARVRVMRGRVALKRVLTSSHAVVLGMLPWLRRVGRGPTAVGRLDPAGAVSATATPGLLTGAPDLLGAPLLLPAAEAAPHLVDRLATLPHVLGLVATLAAPIAAPAVGDQIATWVSQPPAATAGPAASEVAAGEVAAGEVVAGEVATGAAVELTTTATGPVRSDALRSGAVTNPPPGSGADTASPVALALSDVVPPTTLVPATQTTLLPAPPTTLTPAPPTTSASAPAPSTTPAPAPPTTPTPAPPTTSAPSRTTGTPTSRSARPPTPPAAPTTPLTALSEPAEALPVAFASALVGDQITRVGAERTELAGRVTWGPHASTASVLDLRATLAFDHPAQAPPEGSVPPPLHFTGEIALSLEDGRTYRLVLREARLDVVDGRTPMSASFELRNPCDVLVATGAVSGEVHLQETPMPSSLDLTFEGEGPAAVPACG